MYNKKLLSIVLSVLSLSTAGYASPSSEDPVLNNYTPENQARFEREQGIQLPTVAHFRSGPRHLYYFAALHAAGHQHPTCVKIKTLINDFKPDCVILGVENSPPALQHLRDQALSPIDRGTVTGTLYAAHLAHKNNIKVVGGIPPRHLIQEKLQHQYTPEELAFFDFTDWLPHAKLGKNTDDSLLACWNVYWKDQDKAAPDFERYREWYVKKMGKDPSLDVLRDTQFLVPMKEGHPLQQMSKHIEDIRDHHAVEVIDSTLSQHSRVLVVYPCSHYFLQFPLLKHRYGAPTYDQKP